jgi:hypothetical protein
MRVAHLVVRTAENSAASLEKRMAASMVAMMAAPRADCSVVLKADQLAPPKVVHLVVM